MTLLSPPYLPLISLATILVTGPSPGDWATLKVSSAYGSGCQATRPRLSELSATFAPALITAHYAPFLQLYWNTFLNKINGI